MTACVLIRLLLMSSVVTCDMVGVTCDPFYDMRQVVVKVKRSDFTVKQHSTSLVTPTSSAVDIAQVAVRLLHR